MQKETPYTSTGSKKNLCGKQRIYPLSDRATANEAFFSSDFTQLEEAEQDHRNKSHANARKWNSGVIKVGISRSRKLMQLRERDNQRMRRGGDNRDRCINAGWHHLKILGTKENNLSNTIPEGKLNEPVLNAVPY